MRYTILFIAVLIAISGFIAYFGDLLGRKMGKKRLTIFNLRPRHTAIIATIITGMLISAFALAALVSVNSQFRKVLTHGEQILAQNERLSSTNTVLEHRNKSLLARRGELERLVAQRQKELDAARDEAAKAGKARDAAVQTVKRLESEIAERKLELDRLRKSSEVAQAELKARAARLKEVQSRLGEAQARLKEAVLRLTTTGAQLARAHDQLAQAQKTLDEQQKKIEEQYQALERVSEEAIEFERQTSELRSSVLVLRQGNEIARGRVSRRQSEFGVQGDLFSLLETASDRARKLGAGVGSNNRAVKLIFRQPVSQEYVLVNQNERACIEMAKDAILKGPGDALVQVICARNSIAGEQAPVEFRLYVDSLIYPSGKRIARATVDGRLSEGRILLRVIEFLQKEVSESAMRAGIVPVSNPDPRAVTGQNPESQVEALMDVVERIKSVNAPARLDAFASADVYAAGPLNMANMRFTVTKIE